MDVALLKLFCQRGAVRLGSKTHRLTEAFLQPRMQRTELGGHSEQISLRRTDLHNRRIRSRPGALLAPRGCDHERDKTEHCERHARHLCASKKTDVP